MKVFVVYSCFVDDPSVVKGIFSTKELAEEATERWRVEGEPTSDWQEFTLDEYLEEAIVLQ